MTNSVFVLLLTGAGLLFANAPIWAQDGGEKIIVPLDDASRPVRVRADLLSGGITVRGADIRNILVEAGNHSDRDSGEGRHPNPKADGMKRLELPGNTGFEITEQDNLVIIKKTRWEGSGRLTITVPRRASLQLKCLNGGNINVEQVEGEIDVDNLNGNINLKNVSGSVLAHSLNGEVRVSLDQVDPSKPMSFSTLNGDIDVTLPANLKANVLLKTDNGEIYSDFDVKLGAPGGMSREGGRQSDGTYRVRIDHTLRGSIAGGGPELRFTSFNGQIYLRKRK